MAVNEWSVRCPTSGPVSLTALAGRTLAHGADSANNRN